MSNVAHSSAEDASVTTVELVDSENGPGDEDEMVLDNSDLRDDLEDVLSQFTFDGTFAAAKAFSQAPNPYLVIEGIGSVGMPLSERDAKCIIAASAQAPFGHGVETVVDTTVRNTWEIDPHRVSFQGSFWSTFMEKTVVPYVWKALGIAPALTPPRCELYKLLLYETGSHFLPHQDTVKSEGMFATVVVILPSTFTGGQVRVQHATEEKVIDMSENSTFQSSVLAWYTDVTHSVEPITSGYRLALSYNLIHTSTNMPAPSLPSTHASLVQLDQTLRKWSQRKYQNEDGGEYNMLAYLLQHQYSEADLRRGVNALKGQDAHKLANVRPVFERLGFLAYIANLEFNIVGYPEDEGHYSKRGKWDDSSYSDGDGSGGNQWSMLEETDRHLRIKNMFSLDGQAIGLTAFDVDDSCLVPKKPFEDINPDKQEYEGYMGNGAGQLDYWYHRTVLVLIPKDKGHSFMFSVYGLGYALPALCAADPANPALDMRQLAAKAVSRLKSSSKELGGMAQIALDWRDISMWLDVCKCSQYLIGLIGVERYVTAIKIFTFEDLRPILEQGLAKTPSMKERLDLLSSIFSQLSPEDTAGHAWCRDQKLHAISRLVSITAADVPSLIEIMKEKGVQKVMDIILPQLQRLTSTLAFWVTFIKALRETSNEENLTSAEDTNAETNTEWADAISTSLSTAVNHWVRDKATHQVNQPIAGAYGSRHSAPTERDKLAQTSALMIDLCLSVGLVSYCQPILDSLVKSSGYTANKFKILYGPLIAFLKKTLGKYQVPISEQPFSGFLRRLIGLYLRDLLGSREPLIPQMPKVGCGCADCAPLNEFLRSTRAEHQFKAGQGRRRHVEYQLSPVSHIVTYQTLYQGNPHSLSIRKRPGILEGYQWTTRQTKAKAFLASVGDETLIRGIMGDLYDDVQKALNGARPFKRSDEQLSRPDGGDVADVPTIAGPSHEPFLPAADQEIVSSTKPTGTKRKKSTFVSLGPVIDLTSD